MLQRPGDGPVLQGGCWGAAQVAGGDGGQEEEGLLGVLASSRKMLGCGIRQQGVSGQPSSPGSSQLRCPVLTVLTTILHFRDYGHLGSETPSALFKVTQLSSGRVGI